MMLHGTTRKKTTEQDGLRVPQIRNKRNIMTTKIDADERSLEDRLGDGSTFLRYL